MIRFYFYCFISKEILDQGLLVSFVITTQSESVFACTQFESWLSYRQTRKFFVVFVTLQTSARNSSGITISYVVDGVLFSKPADELHMFRSDSRRTLHTNKALSVLSLDAGTGCNRCSIQHIRITCLSSSAINKSASVNVLCIALLATWENKKVHGQGLQNLRSLLIVPISFTQNLLLIIGYVFLLLLL